MSLTASTCTSPSLYKQLLGINSRSAENALRGLQTRRRKKEWVPKFVHDVGGVETVLKGIPTACGKQKPSAAQLGTNRQFEKNMKLLNCDFENELAENTSKNYLNQWRLFSDWALKIGIPTLPADPEQVAAYISERNVKLGHKPATLHTAAAAIAFAHRATGLVNPCDDPGVKSTLKKATRRTGKLQRQAEALTVEVMAEISATACKPRRGRGGNLESRKAAITRGKADIAMISLMRDAMLRVSETAAVKWGDIEAQPDGTGRLLIRRSKTDPEGEGAVAFISCHTMKSLDAMRNGATDSDSVIGLRPNQISKRIKQAAQAAGLGNGFSGHSPRIGMARDLARAGTELTNLMNAGRWSSTKMPALYTRNETAGKGAVAQFYSAR